MQGETTRITLLVTQTLERIGIPYAVGGSLASSLHGIIHSKLDVDVMETPQSALPAEELQLERFQ
jgi:hypothetical protein